MIPREALISQSVYDWMKDKLDEHGYDSDIVTVREAFPMPEERSKPLEISTVAIGFVFDDGGTPAEIGSGLTRYVHTIEFWVFGLTPDLARNVAYTMRHLIMDQYVIPIKDYGVDGDPIIDNLPVEDERAVRVQQQISETPRAWDNYVWTTTAKFEDYYVPGVEALVP